MLYKINNGAVWLGGDTILENVNFEIRDTDKIAVVGRNGCGKTTLLKLISGEVDLYKRDSDEDIFISKSGNPTIGYLKQMTFEDDTISMETEIRKVFAPMVEMKNELDRRLNEMNENPTDENVKRYAVYEEEFRMAGGYYYEKDFEVMVRKFGFSEEDKKKPLNEFSGGQQTRIAFIRMLLSKPDILLLDEPTNHLDIETVEWLESYLKNYDRAVVVVSHDRMFLDNIAEVVYEIEYGVTKRYVGNYSDFVERKAAEHEKWQKDYDLQQKEIARLQTIADRFKNKPTKVSMAKSKLKAIEHMDIIDEPDKYDNRTFHANIQPLETTGKEVINVMNLGVGYDEVLSTVNFTAIRGDKIGIIGGNGLGKSTFLKTIMGEIPALSGEYKLGLRVSIGYFHQQMALYTSEKQVIDDYWDEFPTLTQTEARSDLGAFLFSGDDVFKKVSMLSGGEKVRLALCKLLKRRPNFLILDEPTNHMDIVGKETLEKMLKNYEGTILFVSHDRYFIKEVSNKLLVFENGYTKFYQFGYEDYMEKKSLESAAEVPKNSKEFTGKTPFSFANCVKTEEKPKSAKNYDNPGKEKSKLERKLSKLEENISSIETDIEKEKAELVNPEYATAYNKLSEIQANIDRLEKDLMEYMEQWEIITKELEEFD
ncbi:MAG: ABC-F type ribosomal protection protein [Lachnospiraceae bacterium]|nr:ABC-F type ribosomal protection protein [Lachnospiraceae bacterium]